MNLALRKTDLAAVALLALALWGNKIDWSWTTPNPTPAPGPVVPAPPAALQAIATPIAALMTGEKAAVDRAELANFFVALAEFHSRDQAKIVSSTEQLRRHNALATDGMFQATGIKGRYASLPDALDKGLGTWLGIVQADGKFQARPLTAADASKAAEYFRALHWAFSQPPAPAGGYS